jgi:hypothetical protein
MEEATTGTSFWCGLCNQICSQQSNAYLGVNTDGSTEGYFSDITDYSGNVIMFKPVCIDCSGSITV